MSEKTKVLVTGGAGFIGSHLTQYLLDLGHEVVVLDIPHPGERVVEGAQYYWWGIDGVNKRVSGVDVIYHLAAIPGVGISWKDPFRTHDTNATGTLRVLLVAKEMGVRRVVFASSSSVYGDTVQLPKRENMATNPLSPYAVSKLAGENYCNAFGGDGLETISLRYFNVYGAGQSFDSAAVIPSFIRALQNGETPVIYGDGTQTRDFTYVKDVVDATILAGQSQMQGVYNIGAGSRYTIKALVDVIAGILGVKGSFEYQDWRRGDVKHSYADISKAKADLGYRPNWNLYTGIKDMMNDVKEK